MRHTSFAMLMAALLLAGSVTAAHAAQPGDPMDDPEIAEYMDDADDFGMPPQARFGPRGRWNRDGGPGPRQFSSRRQGPGFGMQGMCGMQGMRGMRGMQGMRGMRGMQGRPWEMLDLTEQQRKDMIDLMTKMFKGRLETRMEMRDLQQAARDIREKDNATAEEIIAAHTALGAARGKQEALQYQLRQEMRGILTEEQLKKMDEFRDSMPRPFRDGRFGPDRPGRPGPDGKRPPQPPKSR